MQKIRYVLLVLSVLLCSVTSAAAQVSIGIGFPNVSIGINLPLYPQLVPVPGYPVYYAPQLDANYFFYDGMYWVYQNDNWYASDWYNGPWWFVEPEAVPLFILRIPVRYYRQPPVYFGGWLSTAPPRWGEHWGHEWEQRRPGWDRWNRRAVPPPAPLPSYQRQYSGNRYPQVEQQQKLRGQHYRYQPRDTTVRQHFPQRIEPRAPAPAQRGMQEEPQMRSQRQQEAPRVMPPLQGGAAVPRSQPPHPAGENIQRPAPAQIPPQQRGPAFQEQRQQPGAAQREQQVPRPQGAPQREQQAPRAQGQEQRSQDRGQPQEQKQKRDRGQGQENKDEERGRDRNN